MNMTKLLIAALLFITAFNARALDYCYHAELDRKVLEHMESSTTVRAVTADKYEELVAIKRRNVASMEADCDRQRKQEAAAEVENDRLAKLSGVRIGMTAKHVRERTNWGEPERTNRTTTAKGVREQWVYGGGNYLYFENGRLVSIQN